MRDKVTVTASDWGTVALMEQNLAAARDAHIKEQGE